MDLFGPGDPEGVTEVFAAVLLLRVCPKIINAFTGSFSWGLAGWVTRYPVLLCKISVWCWEEMGPSASSPSQPSPRRAKPLITQGLAVWWLPYPSDLCLVDLGPHGIVEYERIQSLWWSWQPWGRSAPPKEVSGAEPDTCRRNLTWDIFKCKHYQGCLNYGFVDLRSICWVMTQEYPKGWISMLTSNSHGGGCAERGTGYQAWAGDSLCSIAIIPSFVKSVEKEQLDFRTHWVAHMGWFGVVFLSKPGASL